MLIHERFVFLHLPKTGGTFISEALERELASDAPVRAMPRALLHAGWKRIPADATGLPVLVYVRNPWDWYVSWYRFKHDFEIVSPKSRDPVFAALSGDGELDFAATVRNACRLFGQVTQGLDLYTAQFMTVVGDGLDSELLTVGRFESLVDDLVRFLDAAGVELSHGAVGRLREHERVNASDRGAYREYYDDDLRDLVGESCGTLIDRYGYAF